MISYERVSLSLPSFFPTRKLPGRNVLNALNDCLCVCPVPCGALTHSALTAEIEASAPYPRRVPAPGGAAHIYISYAALVQDYHPLTMEETLLTVAFLSIMMSVFYPNKAQKSPSLP